MKAPGVITKKMTGKMTGSATGKITREILTVVAIGAAILLTLSSMANAQVDSVTQPIAIAGNHELISDIKEQTQLCALELIKAPLALESADNNSKVVGYRSLCPSLVLLSSRKAQIFVDNAWYTAILKESPDADGGDLDDLYVFDAQGVLAGTRTNVAAFDQIILALNGGSYNLTRQMVP